jgi:hypothetical protein
MFWSLEFGILILPALLNGLLGIHGIGNPHDMYRQQGDTFNQII